MSHGNRKHVVTHIIQQLTLGGAARALVATSKYSSKKGPFIHKVISLVAPTNDGRELAKSNGVEVLEGLSEHAIKKVIEQSDIIHINWWNNPQVQKLLRSELPKMRTLVWYHVAGDHAPQLITPSIAGFADINIATNPYTYRSNEALSPYLEREDHRKLRMIVDPADLERVKGVELVKHEGFNVGYIGTVDYFKMHREFVPMSASIDVPDIQFMVCGGGIQDQLFQEARQIGQESKFQFLGYVKDISTVISQFDVYGYPLCEGTYASGELNLQEVMACGVPPVVFPYGGVKDLIQNEKNGIIVESPKEYKEAVEYLYHNPDKRVEIGRQAAKKAWNDYGAENAAKKLIEIYLNLLEIPKSNHIWGQSDIEQEVASKLEESVSVSQIVHAGAETFCDSMWRNSEDFRTSASESSEDEFVRSDVRICQKPSIIHDVGILPYLSEFSDDPYLNYWSGLFWLAKGEYPQAQHAFVRAVQTGLTGFRPHACLSLVGQLSNNPSLEQEALSNSKTLSNRSEEFITELKNVLERPENIDGKSGDDLVKEACDYMDNGKWESATQCLLRLLDSNAASPEILQSLATCAIEAGDLENAEKWLKKACDLPGSPTLLRFQLSQIQQLQGKSSDALESARQYADLERQASTSFLKYFGELLFEHEQYGDACRVYHKVVNEDNRDWESYFYMAHCMARRHETVAARELAEVALSLKSDYQPLRDLVQLLDMSNKSALSSSGQDKGSPKESTAEQAPDPGEKEFIEWFDSQSEISIEEEAAALKEARSQYPESLDILEKLGVHYLKAGSLEDSRDTFQLVVSRDSERESAWTYLAQSAIALGNEKLLEKSIANALRINPKSIDGNHILAILHFQNGQYLEAAKLYHSLITECPITEEYYTGLKECFSQLGDVESEKQVEERISELRAASLDTEAESQVSESKVKEGNDHYATPDVVHDFNPKVSVIVSTYNNADYIGGCLDDLIKQTIFNETEILVIDSGSEQNEGELVAPYCEKYKNIIYLRTDREPLYDAWNRGVKIAKGAYITNANTDDAHRPDALEILSNALDNDTDAELAYGDLYWTDKPNDTFDNPSILKEVKYPDYSPSDAIVYCPMGCHPMWRKSVFDKIGLFNSEFKIIGDYEYLLRFVEAGLKAIHVPETISLFYQNELGLSKNDSGHDQEIGLLFDRFRSRIGIEKLVKITDATPSKIAQAWAGMGTKLCLGVKIPWGEKPVSDWNYAIFCLSNALTINPELWAARVNLCIAAAKGLRNDVFNKHFQQIPEERREVVLTGVKTQTILWEGFACPSPIPNKSNISVNEINPLEESDPGQSDFAGSDNPVKIDMPIRWVGPTFNESGFASELHTFIFSLYEKGIKPSINNIGLKISQQFLDGLSDDNRDRLFEMRDSYIHKNDGLLVQTGDSNLQPKSGAEYFVGRVMFETDRLPERWLLLCNKMDELWVSGQPQKEAYLNSGVPEHKIHILNSPVDESLFNPAHCKKLDLGTGRTFNFFAIFEWIHRKGWDVLFESYFREFSAHDDVCLILRTYLPGVSPMSANLRIQNEIEKIARKIGKSKKDLPKIKVLDSVIPSTLLPAFYHSVDCVLSPSRGEGWGRPQLEAMLMGKPVVATGWGGNMEFMTPETNYLIDYELRPVSGIEPIYWDYKGSNWAEPSSEHLSSIMRRVVESPEEGRRVGAKARQHILDNFGRNKITSQLVTHLERIQDRIKNGGFSLPILDNPIVADTNNPISNKIHVALEGTYLDFGSLSKVNRELGSALESQEGIRISKVQIKQDQDQNVQEFSNIKRSLKPRVPSKVDFHLRHHWPPNWSGSKNNKVILIQPWEFGRIPQEWVQAANREGIEEIWCYSRAVMNAYIDSGVLPEKLRLMSLGFDPQIYHPDGDLLDLKTNKKTKFLFVGGTIHRKGPDILVDAYCKAFSKSDDVSLIIKDFGGKGVYEGQTFEDEINELRNRPGSPEIIYINQEMSEKELASLYRACDCLVHPYRGEGFGLPVLEAMACGLPVVVTAGGSTDDFVSQDFGWKIPAKRKMIGNSVSNIPLEGEGWMLEPDVNELSNTLKVIIENSSSMETKGKMASEFVHENMTWKKVSHNVLAAIHQISDVREQKRLRENENKDTSIELPHVAYIGHLGVATQAFQEKQYPKAKEEALKAIAKRPFHPEAYALLTEVYLELGDSAAAREAIGCLRKMAPKFKKTKSLSKRIKSVGKQGKNLSNSHADIPKPGTRLSVCLITKNEEEHLPRCLASIRDIADQIVVVDTGSTDRTIEIAKEYNATIETFEWNENFSDPRNKSLELATGDWILILDADEEVDEETKPVLLHSLNNAENMAYRLPIIDVGREDQGVNYVPRLFRNAPALFFVGRIHEQVFSSIEVRRKEWGLQSAFGEAMLIHHGYTDKMNDDRGKIHRNLMLLEKALEEMPGEPNLLMNIGMELSRGGNPSAGIEYYFDAIQILEDTPADQISPELRETLLLQLSSYLLARGNRQEIIDLMSSRLAKIGEIPASLHFTVGLAQMDLGKFSEALHSFTQCVRNKDKKTYSVVNTQIKSGAPLHCLGMCLEKTNKFDQALENFGKALHLSPESNGIQQDFMRLTREQNLHLKAIDILNQNMCEGEDSLIFWKLGSQICLDNDQLHGFGVEWVDEALKYYPEDLELNQTRWRLLLESSQLQKMIEGKGPADNHLTAEIFAGIVWARLLHGQPLPHAPVSLESKISGEMIEWYKKWVNKGEEQLIRAINDNIELIRPAYPTAYSVVENVLEQIA